MSHRISATAFPAFGAPERIAPAMAREPGVRVSGVVHHGTGLVFHAEGPELAPGIYAQATMAPTAPTQLVLADEPPCSYLEPLGAGDWLALHRTTAGRVPSHVEAILLRDRAGREIEAPGQAVGLGAHVALVMDLDARVLRRVTLASGEVSELAAVQGRMDPQLASQISLHPSEALALFVDAREERGDASLELVDLATGEVERLHGPVPAPSWITAAFAPDGETIVALEVRPGDAPLSRLLRLRRGGAATEIFRAEVAQPHSAPAFADARTVVMPLTLEPYPFASYGPVDLVALLMTGGVQLPLTRWGDIRGRARVCEGAVWIEGGDVVVRVPFAAP